MTLHEFFSQNPHVAIAFSGGVDSSYLLYAAKEAGAQVRAYMVQSAFQPQFELDDARALTSALGVPLQIVPVEVLLEERIIQNSKNRCYYCKRLIFQSILQTARADGFSLLLDGTNASDKADDRPGMQALLELGIRSPLRECGLQKEDIRRLSREAGLFTWNKPAYACLATRIASGERITAEALCAAERSERFLSDFGFFDFRVRRVGNCAKLQLREEQFPLLLTHREEILSALKPDYEDILLDLEARK